jgi:hypothetical protein
MNEEAEVRVPCAKVEVEVLLPVAKLLRGCRSLGKDRNRAKASAHGEEKKIESNARSFQVDHIRSSH